MGAAEGVLEHTALLLGTRNPSGRQPILDAATLQPVGFSMQRRPSGFLASLRRRVVAVHEQEDESLLFTMRRCRTLFSWFEVWDADDVVIGWHGLSMLLDRAGRRLAARDDAIEPGTSCFVSPSGQLLARLTWRGENALLTFTNAVADDPFTKMMLLAAALRWCER